MSMPMAGPGQLCMYHAQILMDHGKSRTAMISSIAIPFPTNQALNKKKTL